MENLKRILIARTDRIGDVVLSTPLISRLRRSFPRSYISVMVRPYARDIVLGNPYINEVIIYDKYGRHKGLWQTIKFAWRLRRKRFDLALLLHPTNRVHLISFLAGIKRRVGFNKKMGFLLTDKIEHKKQEGRKHEAEYTLEMLRPLGIETDNQTADLFMPIRKDSENYIEQFLADYEIGRQDKLVAFHPSASCPSKIWPVERFARVANNLAGEYKLRVVLVGADSTEESQGFRSLMKRSCVDFSGKTTVSQLASLLRRCSLFISTDSGPVHIARALGVPAVVIFGRKQPGLSPRRWGPAGKDSIILHKDAGCKECLAHNCRKGFSCLQAVSVEEVHAAAKALFSI